MSKREKVKEILQSLLGTKQTIYSKGDIEKAIMECRDVSDPRAIRNWFHYLWRLEYLIQPEKGLYKLNYDKVAELEIDSKILDVEQRRLFYA